MDLSVFFSASDIHDSEQFPSWSLGHAMTKKPAFPHWRQADIVLVGVPALDRPQGLPSAIRHAFYQLSCPDVLPSIVDLGDIKPKDDQERYEDALSYVLEQLFEARKTVVLLADDAGFSFPLYRAYEHREFDVNYVHVGSKLALEAPHEGNSAQSFNQRILRHEPNYLFSFSHLGYQRFLVDPEALQSLNDLHCAAVRYGELEAEPEEIEPFLRDASLLSLDLAVMRKADMPASSEATPAGFSVLEISKLTRYAGLSEKLDSFLITGFEPEHDKEEMSAKTAAIALWYFCEGFGQRHPDAPASSWRRYSVTMDSPPHQIDFLESPRSGRWWMEVPYPEAIGRPGSGPVKRVPCSRKDYEAAQRDEIPARWWRTQHRLA